MSRLTRRALLGSVPLTVGLAGCLGGDSDEGDGTTNDGSSSTTNGGGSGTTNDGGSGSGTTAQSTTEALTEAPTTAKENTIRIGVDDENHVAPDSITIQSGDGVHFQAVSGNHEIYCTHDRPEGGQAWSFRLEEGQSRGIVIEVTGRYQYHCAFHDRNGGVIIVE